MKNKEREKIKMATKVKTNKVRLSYAHLFEKHGFEGNTPKYSVTLMIPKTDMETIDALKSAYREALEAGVEKFGKSFTKAEYNAPFVRPAGGTYGLLKDGDSEDAEGYYLLPVKSNDAPGVLAKETGMTRLTKENGGPDIVYSGCYAKATVNVFPFNNPKAGISASLNNILKIKDGEKFGGIAKAEDDFAAELAEIEASLADLI